ncbi:glycosyltransferase family 2 protein [Methyloversatilis thermotolerans]|uniref:glycosyltransferase family 2 protein n=1 Tax=Methyloversatilis thermotolerans TaxID=1346290 RepID=UPI0003682E6C|nr:glycosyltransferase [Methyloversatilis thermotolerans]
MLSVVIPARDAARWIGSALASVHAQDGIAFDAVIVVDDGSHDGTAAIARAAGAQVIAGPGNGPSAARNAGVAACDSEYIAFLDADDMWPDNSLLPRLQQLAAHPDAAFVFGDCRQFDDRDGRRYPHVRTVFEQSGCSEALFGDAARVMQPLAALLDADFVTTGSVIMRRSVFVTLGGFDTRLRRVEDLDLWLRAAASHAVLWHPGLALLRRRHGGNLSADAAAMLEAHIAVLERVAKLPQAAALAARLRGLRRRDRRALAGLLWSRGQRLVGLASLLRAWAS